MEKILKQIGKTASRIGLECYVVGGYVRDSLLGLPNKDLDVMVIGKGIDMAREFAKDVGVQDVITYSTYGTASVTWRNLEIEFVGARKESYVRGSRNPVVEDGTLEDDLTRRDFTVNALAIKVTPEGLGSMVDLFDGKEDLEKKILRTPVDPRVTFTDDPLRMLRCIRFACRLGFKIHPETYEALKDSAEGIRIITAERISGELSKILMSKDPGQGFMLLQDTGLLGWILPELSALDISGKGHKNNFLHSVKVLGNLVRDYPESSVWLRVAALLHDIGKGPTEKSDGFGGWTYYGHPEVGAGMIEEIFKRLRLPLGHDTLGYVRRLVSMHMRPSMMSTREITDSAVRRLLFDSGGDMEDLMKLCRSDLTTGNPEKRERILLHFDKLEEMLSDLQKRDQVRLFQPCIGGKEIMEILGCRPGKLVGEVKEFLKSVVLEGLVENDPEVLKNLVKEKYL